MLHDEVKLLGYDVKGSGMINDSDARFLFILDHEPLKEWIDLFLGAAGRSSHSAMHGAIVERKGIVIEGHYASAGPIATAVKGGIADANYGMRTRNGPIEARIAEDLKSAGIEPLEVEPTVHQQQYKLLQSILTALEDRRS